MLLLSLFKIHTNNNYTIKPICNFIFEWQVDIIIRVFILPATIKLYMVFCVCVRPVLFFATYSVVECILCVFENKLRDSLLFGHFIDSIGEFQ